MCFRATSVRHSVGPRMKTVALVSVFVVALVVSVITYTAIGSFLFARGSDTDFAVARSGERITALVLAALAGGPLLASRFRSSPATALTVIVALSVWALSGRAVGLFGDGRIVAGWFFLRTTSVDLRQPGEDFEVYASRVRVVALPGWSIELRAAARSERLFVGPASWRSCIQLLSARGFKVEV